MKLRSLTLAFLLLAFIMTGASYAAEYDVLAEETSETAAPAGMDEIIVHGFAGAGLSFAKEDFLTVLGSDEAGLRGIVVTRTPDHGSLVFANRAMLAGEAVTTQTLDTLRYVPVTFRALETTFQFIPVYVGSGSGRPVNVTLVLSHKENLAPEARDVEIKTYRDIAVRGRFAASDPEGDALSFRISTKAKRGEVEIGADGTFIYTPFRKKTGSDSFQYVAVDAYGNTSAEATVQIKIDKPATKTTYADMDGHEASYAALRLHEEGIFTGETVCGVQYFRPDEPLSRAEWIAMTVRMMGLDEDMAQTGYTGFADDESIPVWFKPYASAALEAGLIQGCQTSDGRIYANAASMVTFSEAAVILNNAITPEDAAQSVLAEAAVPVWAAKAVRNLDSEQVLPVSVADYNAPVTRADAALMLESAMERREASAPKGGLLSWVFGW